MARYRVRALNSYTAANTWQLTWAEQRSDYQRLPIEWFRDSDPRTSDRVTTVQFTQNGTITVAFSGRLLPEVEKSLTITLDTYGRVIVLPGPYFSNTDLFTTHISYATGEYTWRVRNCNFDKFIESLPTRSSSLARFDIDYPGLYYRVKDELTYPFDGVISEGDDWESMRREMNIGMAGYMPDRNGSLVMLPGATRTPVAHITQADLTGDYEWNTKVPSEQLANRATMQLNSSDGNSLQREEVRPYQNNNFLRLDDDTNIDVDFGNRAFLNSRRAASRLQAVLLKRARRLGYGTFRLLPGVDLKNWNIYAGDYITMTFPKLYLNNTTLFVTSSTYNTDFSVELGVQVEPASTYNDVAGAPYPPSQRIEYVSNTDPDTPPQPVAPYVPVSPGR